MANRKIEKPDDSVVPTPSHVEVPEGYLLSELEGNKHVDEKIKTMIKNVIVNDKDTEKEIKKIVWQSIREKIIWIIIGGLITLGGIFLKAYVENFAEYIAKSQIPSASSTTQNIPSSHTGG